MDLLLGTSIRFKQYVYFLKDYFLITLSKGSSYSPFLLFCLGEHWPRRLMIKWPQSQTREPPSSRLSCGWVITELIFSINWVDKCNCGSVRRGYGHYIQIQNTFTSPVKLDTKIIGHQVIHESDYHSKAFSESFWVRGSGVWFLAVNAM